MNPHYHQADRFVRRLPSIEIAPEYQLEPRYHRIAYNVPYPDPVYYRGVVPRRHMVVTPSYIFDTPRECRPYINCSMFNTTPTNSPRGSYDCMRCVLGEGGSMNCATFLCK